MPVGRKPKPTSEKILQGNPGKKALNKNEPVVVPIDKLPDPPDWMGEYGQKEWRRVGPVLLGSMLMTESDLLVFATYCQNVDLMIESSLNIKENGHTIVGARGRVKNPAVSNFIAATTALRTLAAEFGMTPSSRSRIKIPGDDGETLGDLAKDLETETDPT